MGRIQQSQGLAPPSVRKEKRAKHARQIINKTIPAILASNTRARKGAEGSELIADPGPVSSSAESASKAKEDGHDDAKYIKRKGQGRRKAKGVMIEDEEPVEKTGRERDEKPSNKESVQSTPSRSVRIINTDTLTAAHLIKTTSKSARKDPNICILNMASPLRPGGGVLTGATSQEETLCTNTTLLPSLNESFYRLPEYGGIFTKDVLVLRDARGELAVQDRWFVDTISSGMLRFPDLLGAEDEEKYLAKKDRLMVERKMRAVLRIASSRGVKKLVLGAWGCGAYGNPVRDVASAWKKVLIGSSSDDGNGRRGNLREKAETWESITEIVFAITNRKMARDFAHAFDPNLAVEPGPGDHDNEENEDETDDIAEELRVKIQEMDSQISKVWNADLKARMDVILDGLRAQLQQRENSHDHDEDEHDTESDDDGAVSVNDEDDDEDEDESDGGKYVVI
jgi:uncharacterized protein (TIGR02452 family)